MSGQTIAQKVLARASGRSRVEPGEIVAVQPDFSYAHDYGLFAIVCPLMIFEARCGRTR
jgi:homoaconitase/3-isopropylmalate dehydratase large subunit